MSAGTLPQTPTENLQRLPDLVREGDEWTSFAIPTFRAWPHPSYIAWIDNCLGTMHCGAMV